MGDDGSVSPVFGVKAPSSFSTKYPEDNSQVFSAQGLVEVDQLGSPYGDCSEELFSDADNRDNFMVTQTDNAQGDAFDSTVTKTFPEDTSDPDVDQTQTGAVSESTFPDTGETPPSIDYATQEGRNKRQLTQVIVHSRRDLKVKLHLTISLRTLATLMLIRHRQEQFLMESTFPDTGETPPSIDYATQEGRNKRQLGDPSNCPFKKRFKSQTGTF